jgi:hypothetical protein
MTMFLMGSNHRTIRDISLFFPLNSRILLAPEECSAIKMSIK